MSTVKCSDAAKTVRDAIRNGKPLVVRFNEKIEATELCADSGWMARVVAVAEETDDGRVAHSFIFDYSQFDAHNDTMANHNYYDRAGNPTLTAKEAGHYRSREEWAFLENEEMPFEFVEQEESNEMNRDARLAALEQKYAALEARLAAMEEK